MRKLISKLPLALSLIAVVVVLGVIGCGNNAKQANNSNQSTSTSKSSQISQQAQNQGLVQVLSTQATQSVSFDTCMNLSSTNPDSNSTAYTDSGMPLDMNNMSVCAGKTNRNIIKIKNGIIGSNICAYPQSLSMTGSITTMTASVYCFAVNSSETVVQYNLPGFDLNYITIVFESDSDRYLNALFSNESNTNISTMDINVNPRAYGATYAPAQGSYGY